jgi:20S proteasome alpha/beta subunit
MTVLVGMVHNGNVYIGADRGASDESLILPLKQPKIARVGQYIIGYSGNIGVGQLAQCIDLPSIDYKSIKKHLRTTFVKAYKDAIDEYGVYDKDDTSNILIGIKGRLFEMDTADFQVSEFDMTAVGSGAHFALGSLYTTNTWKDPIKRITKAIEVACELSPGCRLPMDIEVL